MILNSRDKGWWKRFYKAEARRQGSALITPPPEVDQPTYEVVGGITRIDQRDTVQSRVVLKQGTPEYEDYYRRHPELKAGDDERHARKVKAIAQHEQEDPLGVAFQPNAFCMRHLLGSPDVVESTEDTQLWEKISEVGKRASAQELTERIKAYALFLGVTKVRVARLRQEWVYTHYAHPYTPEPYGKPVELDYPYVICLALRQNLFVMKSGNNYIPSVEVGVRYGQTSVFAVTLANLIRSWGFRARALTPENSPLMIVPTFIDAGIGEQGRLGHVVTKEFGNNFRPAAVATDMPMMVDKPVDFGLQDFCDKCRVCEENCPVGAIPKEKSVQRGVRRWQIDADKCRRYWDSIGHACGVCQISCPWNFDSTFFHNLTRELNQRYTWLRKPAIWGYKLFYQSTKWVPDPYWISTRARK